MEQNLPLSDQQGPVIQVDSLQQKLMAQVDGILAVHEFHIWQLAGDRIIASAHIRCLNLAQYMQVNI